MDKAHCSQDCPIEENLAMSGHVVVSDGAAIWADRLDPQHLDDWLDRRAQGNVRGQLARSKQDLCVYTSRAKFTMMLYASPQLDKLHMFFFRGQDWH